MSPRQGTQKRFNSLSDSFDWELLAIGMRSGRMPFIFMDRALLVLAADFLLKGTKLMIATNRCLLFFIVSFSILGLRQLPSQAAILKYEPGGSTEILTAITSVGFPSETPFEDSLSDDTSVDLYFPNLESLSDGSFVGLGEEVTTSFSSSPGSSGNFVRFQSLPIPSIFSDPFIILEGSSLTPNFSYAGSSAIHSGIIGNETSGWNISVLPEAGETIGTPVVVTINSAINAIVQVKGAQIGNGRSAELNWNSSINGADLLSGGISVSTDSGPGHPGRKEIHDYESIELTVPLGSTFHFNFDLMAQIAGNGISNDPLFRQAFISIETFEFNFLTNVLNPIVLPPEGDSTGNEILGGSTVTGGIDASFDNVTIPGNLTAEYTQTETHEDWQEIMQEVFAGNEGSPGADVIDFRLSGFPVQHWDITFEGEFEGEAELTFAYDDTILTRPEETLEIRHYNEGTHRWERLETIFHDLEANTITVLTSSFSPLVLASVPEPTSLLIAIFVSLGMFLPRRRTQS